MGYGKEGAEGSDVKMRVKGIRGSVKRKHKTRQRKGVAWSQQRGLDQSMLATYQCSGANRVFGPACVSVYWSGQ